MHTSPVFSKISIVVFLVLSGAGCVANPSTPTSFLPNIPAWHLLLDAQAFPKDWEIGPCGPTERTCFGETHAIRDVGRVGLPGHVLQDVYRLQNDWVAKAKFHTYREVDFKVFHPPPEITYHSPIADEYYLGCGIDKVPACRAIFRYGNYFIYFYFDIDSGKGDGLKLEQVEPILRAMDVRAAAVLGLQPKPTKTP